MNWRLGGRGKSSVEVGGWIHQACVGFSSPVSWRHSLILDVIFCQLFGIQEPVLPFISSREWRVGVESEESGAGVSSRCRPGKG